MMSPNLEAFRALLREEGLAPSTVAAYVGTVRGFLKTVGDRPVTRLSEAEVLQFFQRYKDKSYKKQATHVVSRWIKFNAARLPVPVNARGDKTPRAAAPGRQQIALRQKWDADKLREEKQHSKELIAKLARKVIDHYVFFQRLLKNGDADLDDVARFADECRELIESNLPLFMTLSAQGHNIHSAIDERVQTNDSHRMDPRI